MVLFYSVLYIYMLGGQEIFMCLYNNRGVLVEEVIFLERKILVDISFLLN